MIYSVFDWNSGQYHYFEGPGESLGIRPKAKADLNDANGRGHKLEDMLREVPAGAVPQGSGTEPKGRIAVLNTALRKQYGSPPPSGFGDTGNPLVDHPWQTLGLFIGGVYVAFKVAGWLGKQVAGVK